MPSEAYLKARAEHLRSVGRDDLIEVPIIVRNDSGDYDAKATKWARVEADLAQFDAEHATV